MKSVLRVIVTPRKRGPRARPWLEQGGNRCGPDVPDSRFRGNDDKNFPRE